MKDTNSRKKITIEVDGEKITASKGFFADYAMLLYARCDRERENGFKDYADLLSERATNVYDKLKASGYFDDIRKER